MKIIPLSEGSFTVDGTKKFLPFDTGSDDLQQRSRGSLLVEIQPFLILTSKDIIVVDTGLGFRKSDGSLQIHQNLLNNGIGAMEVTKVLVSHLHKDHSGGISMEDGILHQRFLSFPNATYYVNRQELDLALSGTSSSYAAADLAILNASDNVVFTTGDGIIDDYIRYAVTGGHSLFHQSFWITEGEEIAFFGGDVAPQLQQMKSRFIAKYDLDGKKSMELRQQWWKQGQEEHWTFLFYHDIKAPVFVC